MNENISISAPTVDISEQNIEESILNKKPIFIINRNVDRVPKRTKKIKKEPKKKNKTHYKRKEKSLEELSHKFLRALASQKDETVCLDEMTNRLGVERRRIYDIINILESLKLLTRRKKNVYKWNGFRMIYQTIHEYQKQTFQKSEEIQLDSSKKINTKREKSLEILSIGFLKLFLSWKKIISLEEAAFKLSFPSSEENKIKTKIRRLYDIANVFKSIGIIKKTHIDAKNKPGFEYLGYQGLDTFLKEFYPNNNNQSQSILPLKKQTTIITQNNIDNMKIENQIELESQENRLPLIENSFPQFQSFSMSFLHSSFKKIKRTSHSPFKPMSLENINKPKNSLKTKKELEF